MISNLVEIARHCWRGAHWEVRSKGPICIKEPLKKRHLEQHLQGGPAVGLAPIEPGTNTTRIALLDFDSHKGEMSWLDMQTRAMRVMQLLRSHGLQPIPFRSRGGHGIHLIMLWDEPQDAASVRQYLASALRVSGLKPGTKGMIHGEVEIFPKQDSVAKDGFGNMFILPLAGESAPLDPVSLEVDENVNIELTYSAPVPLSEKLQDYPKNPKPNGASNYAEISEFILRTPNPNLPYDEWFKNIAKIHHATDGSDEGRALAHQWSSKSNKYDEQFLDKHVWPYLKVERDGPVSVLHVPLLDDVEDISGDAHEGVDTRENPDGGAAPRARPPATGPARSPRFRAEPASVFVQRPEPEWIIPGIVPEKSLMVIYGESGSGKTFTALDLGGAIATGRNWRGIVAKMGAVLYICAEGAGGFRNRLEAYMNAHCPPEVYKLDLWVIDGRPNLLKKPDANAIVAAARAVREDPWGFVVIDTLAQAIPGGNENASEDMTKLLDQCATIRDELGATVCLIHHSGKNVALGARGWSGLKGAVDAELEVQRIGQARTIVVTKAKDDEDGARYPFRLNVVPVGTKGRTSCYVEHVLDSVPAPRREPVGELQQHIYRTAVALLDVDFVLALSELEAAVMTTGSTVGNVRKAIGKLERSGFLSIDNGKVRDLQKTTG